MKLSENKDEVFYRFNQQDPSVTFSAKALLRKAISQAFMKRIILTILALSAWLLAQGASQARIGWTLEQCRERYGKLLIKAPKVSKKDKTLG